MAVKIGVARAYRTTSTDALIVLVMVILMKKDD